jgi:hypothetical protein
MRFYAWVLASVLLASPTVLGANLTSLSVSPASVVGGMSATGTATLDAPAPAGGAVVTLTSSVPTRATRARKG